MGSLGKLGLQRRVSLYVAVGLTLMLGIYAYLGVRAVHQSTALVFQERLAMGEGIAAHLAQSFEHVIDDTEERLVNITPDSGQPTWERAVAETFFHLSEVDRFPWLKVSGVWLITQDTQIISSPPLPLPIPQGLIPAHLWGNSTPSVFRPVELGSNGFMLLAIPLTDGGGRVWGVALVNTRALSSSHPFTPLSFLEQASEESPDELVEPPRQSQYQLEVLGPEGTTLLAMGPHLQEGRPSPHFPIVKALMEPRRSSAMLHHQSDNPQFQGHVLAIVPVPRSDLYLVLEQEQDIALALPNELRRQLILFGGVGLLLTLAVAWITTYHVVRPTQVLTVAAERMAKGELSTPVTVRAQDEIGCLAESLEVMRQRLNSALQEIEQANRELEFRVKERTEQLQGALEKVISAQEEERRRLARELHDETAQDLGALTIMLDGIRDKAMVEPEAAQRQAQEAKELAAKLLEETRRLIFDLRPTVLDDFGLVPALRWYAESHLEKRGIKTTIEGDSPTLPLHMQVALFRIAQEAINNIAKHAQARSARIEVSTQDTTIILVVEDDGQGFDVAAEGDQASRVGLVGMRERANLLGAKLEISSRPGQGTRVRLELPTEAEHV